MGDFIPQTPRAGNAPPRFFGVCRNELRPLFVDGDERVLIFSMRACSHTLTPREEFSRIHSAHQFLKRWAQLAVASAKNSRRGVPRSGVWG